MGQVKGVLMKVVVETCAEMGELAFFGDHGTSEETRKGWVWQRMSEWIRKCAQGLEQKGQGGHQEQVSYEDLGSCALLSIGNQVQNGTFTLVVRNSFLYQ